MDEVNWKITGFVTALSVGAGAALPSMMKMVAKFLFRTASKEINVITNRQVADYRSIAADAAMRQATASLAEATSAHNSELWTKVGALEGKLDSMEKELTRERNRSSRLINFVHIVMGENRVLYATCKALLEEKGVDQASIVQRIGPSPREDFDIFREDESADQSLEKAKTV